MIRPAFFSLVLLAAPVLQAAPARPLEIVFDAPAKSWEREALPVGNGRLGAMVFGDPRNERIQFNEISLWSGDSNESGGYDVESFGTYQSFGDLRLAAADAKTPCQGYRRALDLATGIQTTTWQSDGVTHTREVFASRAGEVLVVRWTADKPGKISASVGLGDPRSDGKGGVEKQSLVIPEAALSNGLRYAACARVVAEGGKATPGDGIIVLDGCTSVTVLLAAETDYAMDPAKNFRNGTAPMETAARRANAAAGTSFAKLRARHLADHAALMGRVALDLGATAEDIRAKPTPERLKLHAAGGADPELETTMFQFGRYLLASCSRPGGLPANLQGLWADGLKPDWFADYHTNINIQMNYWLAEPANLPECHEALFDWVIACIPESRKATLKAFGDKTPGWTMRTSVNAFGGNGWQWNLPSSAWLSRHFWEHYAFGGNKEFLKTKAWPVLKEVTAFWLDHLKEDKDGKLVVPQGWSPEHGPREDGVAHDQQIVWDLFTNTLAAASALGIDDDMTRKIAAARENLLGPKIGSWGQIMEWTTERPDLEKSGHRHTSHLFAVYPGNQINIAKTPELAKAAAVSLEARGTSGDSRRSWTWPWRTAMWARLGEPEKAYAMVRGLLQYNTMPNLYATHPPFQMDGNFGITAGICEMLLQSHAGEIAVLPAVPGAWKTGSFTGLRARGGFMVDAAWKDGKPASVAVVSALGAPCRLRVPGGAKLTTAAGQRVAGATTGDGVLVFPTKARQAYKIAW